jgi:N-acetylneuraminate synthase
MAKDCGCDAVKFQKRNIDIVYTPEQLNAYRESPWGTTQRAQKQGLEFGVEQYDEIDQYCKSLDIVWFASPWDVDSFRFLDKYDCPYNKIASAMLTHPELVEEVAAAKKPTFISTGMSNYPQIDEVVAIFKSYDCPFTLMHAVSTYPCADEDCNLQMIRTLQARYQCPVGYSGHEVGVLPSLLAATLGATVIERHITLDRAMYGSDQAASLEKRGLEILVRDIRSMPGILGDGVKRILSQELEVAAKLRYFKPLVDSEVVN